MSEKLPTVQIIREMISPRRKIKGDIDPRTFHPRLKIYALIVICMAGAMGGFSSTVYYPGIPSAGADLHAPPIATSLTTAAYVLSLGIAPIIWGYLSDYYKIRKPLIFASIVIYAISSIICALASCTWVLILFRIIQAIGASSSLAIGGGVISAIYTIEQRGHATAVFFFGRYIGPIVVSRDTTENYQQRSDEGKKEDRKRKPFNFLRPFLLLRFPNILLSSLVGAIAFGSLCVIDTIILILYQRVYGFNGLQIASSVYLKYYSNFLKSKSVTHKNIFPTFIGLSYIGAGIGHILGAVTNGYLSDKLLLHARKKREGVHNIEDRITLNLWPCCLLLMPLGLLLFGWSVEYNMPYWVGILGFGIQTFATSQMYSASTAYLIDTLPGQGASVSAAGNFVYMTFACSLEYYTQHTYICIRIQKKDINTLYSSALVSIPILENVGSGYLSVIIACLGWIAAGMLLINKVYGQHIRQHFNLVLEDEHIK
ncbi:major facilitator superfamily domain-containing protein [Phascolomyces articulosus]|uniref:Major facilitator superfamily domain-containing protein n=1 Tax=Phascolomyces articulosus TaxID=60185 RepID=A0AAD5PIG5_9FUNG|nr:major facilitator superfamily domain-containing protein [Phascolomyces articulosus]